MANINLNDIEEEIMNAFNAIEKVRMPLLAAMMILAARYEKRKKKKARNAHR